MVKHPERKEQSCGQYAQNGKCGIAPLVGGDYPLERVSHQLGVVPRATEVYAAHYGVAGSEWPSQNLFRLSSSFSLALQCDLPIIHPERNMSNLAKPLPVTVAA